MKSGGRSRSVSPPAPAQAGPSGADRLAKAAIESGPLGPLRLLGPLGDLVVRKAETLTNNAGEVAEDAQGQLWIVGLPRLEGVAAEDRQLGRCVTDRVQGAP